MDYVHHEITEDQSCTYPSVEYFGTNFHVSCSKRIRKFLQRHDPVFGAAREWYDDGVASIVYMIHGEYINRNVNRDYILLLMDELCA